MRLYKTPELAMEAACTLYQGAHCDLRTKGVRAHDSSGAWGWIYLTPHTRKCKDGQYRRFWSFQLGG